MKQELRKILEETYGGIENFVIKKPDGAVVFSLSYSEALNLGQAKSSPFFICPTDEKPSAEASVFNVEDVRLFCPYFEGDKILLDGMFPPLQNGVIISGVLYPDLVLRYNVESLNPEFIDKQQDLITLSTDVKRLYQTGPVTAFSETDKGEETVKNYMRDIFKALTGQGPDADATELSKFIFEELKFRYRAI